MFARWSVLSEPLPLAPCDLPVVRSSLIEGFYSDCGTRVARGLSSGVDALAREEAGRPGRRRAFRAADLVRVALRERLEQLAVARLAQLCAHRSDGRLDHRVAVAPAHQVRAHLVEVLGRGLDQHDPRAVRAQLLRLAAEPATGES